MTDYETLIDGTSFGTVRNYINCSHSEVTDVLFVTSEDLLPEIARLLDTDNHAPPQWRRFRWDVLLRGGQVIPNAHTQGFGVDVEAIPDDTFCRVLYMPPLYLVHLPIWRRLSRIAAPES